MFFLEKKGNRQQVSKARRNCLGRIYIISVADKKGEEEYSLFGWAENGWFQPLGCIQPFGWAETSRSARGYGWDRRPLNPPHPLATVP
jgi:hypothetical protein